MTSPPAVVAITGVSGYLGRVLATVLRDDPRVERIVGIDTRPPGQPLSHMEFHQLDITASRLEEVFRSQRVSHVAHLAFRLAPNHDRAGTRKTNFDGSRNVLHAAAAVGVAQLVFASSSVVYGPQPDATEPIGEDHPRRPTRQVQYTIDKIEFEDLCHDFRQTHPEINVSILRLVTIVGPAVDNFIFRFLKKPIIIMPWRVDPPWQFVHELDAARAFQTALFSNRSGTYNLGADGAVRLHQILQPLGKPTVAIPRAAMKLATNLCWYLRWKNLTEIPGALIDFMCYPPVVSNERIKDELQFEFRYTSHESIATYLQAQCDGAVRLAEGGWDLCDTHTCASASDESSAVPSGN